jgi:hypothetical protein
LVAIGCAAVVNLLAHFYLKNCGVWIAAAARQIAGEPDSHRGSRRLSDLRHTIESPTKSAQTPILLELWCGIPTKPAKRPHRVCSYNPFSKIFELRW